MMKTMKSPQETWCSEEAARLAREAYRYVARTYLLDANLGPLGVADARVVEAEEQGDWPAPTSRPSGSSAARPGEKLRGGRLREGRAPASY
jgi:hypothetical protein